MKLFILTIAKFKKWLHSLQRINSALSTPRGYPEYLLIIINIVLQFLLLGLFFEVILPNISAYLRLLNEISEPLGKMNYQEFFNTDAFLTTTTTTTTTKTRKSSSKLWCTLKIPNHIQWVSSDPSINTKKLQWS